MAKFLSEEVFTIMSFVSINDCFKRPDLIHCNLIVFVPRKDKSEIKHLFHIKKKYRQIPIILLLNKSNSSFVLEPDIEFLSRLSACA